MFSAPPPPPASRRHSRLHSASLRLPRPLFKGVRKRSWGRWVSEIRVPHSRAKIWLGSYSMPELAARAYDAAYLILRGPSAAAAALNFPDSSLLMNPHLAAYYADCSAVTRRTIQIAAAAIANAIAGAEDRMLSPPASEEQALTERGPGNEDAQIDSAQEGEGLQGVVSMEAGWANDALHVVSPIGGGSCATASEDRMQEGALDMEMLRSASSDELLLQALQAALIQDGFTPVSSAVTSRERFDTDVACPFDPLWTYPS